MKPESKKLFFVFVVLIPFFLYGFEVSETTKKSCAHFFNTYDDLSSELSVVTSENVAQALSVACTSTPGCLSGKAFEDYNCNGMEDTYELGVEGVEVAIYDSENNPVGTIQTDAGGEWQLCGLTDGDMYRVEFILPVALSNWAKPTHSGNDNGTDVQFLTVPSCTKFSLSSPDDYCNNNPFIGVSCYVTGDASVDEDALATFSNSASNKTATATASQIGSTWGIAFDRNRSKILAASFLKRHIGLGPGGLDAIYVLDFDPIVGGIATVSHTIDLSSIGVDVGSNPRTITLPNTAGTPSHDPEVFPHIGRIGIGDIDISEDYKTLYLVNLFSKELVILDVSDYSNVTVVNTYPIPDPGCGDGSYRPFAIELHKGRVYVGTTCSAETSQDVTDLEAYVMELDLAGGTFTNVASFPLDYNRPGGASNIGNGNDNGGSSIEFKPWITTFTSGGWPMPCLMDIELDTDESLILSIANIEGYMEHPGQYSTDVSNSSIFNWSILACGDILRICKVNGAYVKEGDPGCDQNHDNPAVGGSYGDGILDEYYYDDFDSQMSNPATYNGHSETNMGSLTLIPGTNEVITAQFDPIGWNSGGVRWLNNTDGGFERGIKLYGGNGSLSSRKGTGLGDVEVFCIPAPLEIGNYVWCDSIENGIQDAHETSVDGMIVQLYSTTGVLIGQDTTVNGNYFFNQNNVDTTGIVVMSYNTDYYMTFGSTQFLSTTGLFNTGVGIYSGITMANANSNANDNIDSDIDGGTLSTALGSMPADLPFVLITTDAIGGGSHHFDLGLTCNPVYDWGDLPDVSAGTGALDYQTDTIHDGPSHLLIGGLFLGTLVDNETDGQESTDALGDGMDEDAISFPNTMQVTAGGTLNIPFAATNLTGNTAYVEMWIDWNGDGDFDESDEMVVDIDDNAGMPNYLSISVPTTIAVEQPLGLRLRLSNTDNMTPYGMINSGEVEDYLIEVSCEQNTCLSITAQ